MRKYWTKCLGEMLSVADHAIPRNQHVLCRVNREEAEDLQARAQLAQRLLDRDRLGTCSHHQHPTREHRLRPAVGSEAAYRDDRTQRGQRRELQRLMWRVLQGPEPERDVRDRNGEREREQDARRRLADRALSPPLIEPQCRIDGHHRHREQQRRRPELVEVRQLPMRQPHQRDDGGAEQHDNVKHHLQHGVRREPMIEQPDHALVPDAPSRCGRGLCTDASRLVLFVVQPVHDQIARHCLPNPLVASRSRVHASSGSFSFVRTPRSRHREYSRCGAKSREPIVLNILGHQSIAFLAPSCTAPNVPRPTNLIHNLIQVIDIESLFLLVLAPAGCTAQRSSVRPCRRSARCAAIARRSGPPPPSDHRGPTVASININLRPRPRCPPTFPTGGRLWQPNGVVAGAHTKCDLVFRLVYHSRPNSQSAPPVHRNIRSLRARSKTVRFLLSSTQPSDA